MGVALEEPLSSVRSAAQQPLAPQGCLSTSNMLSYSRSLAQPLGPSVNLQV